MRGRGCTLTAHRQLSPFELPPAAQTTVSCSQYSAWSAPLPLRIEIRILGVNYVTVMRCRARVCQPLGRKHTLMCGFVSTNRQSSDCFTQKVRFSDSYRTGGLYEVQVWNTTNVTCGTAPLFCFSFSFIFASYIYSVIHFVPSHRTLWGDGLGECTTCRTSGNPAWTCPAAVSTYADIGGSDADIVELDGSTGDNYFTIFSCEKIINFDRQW